MKNMSANEIEAIRLRNYTVIDGLCDRVYGNFMVAYSGDDGEILDRDSVLGEILRLSVESVPLLMDICEITSHLCLCLDSDEWRSRIDSVNRLCLELTVNASVVLSSELIPDLQTTWLHNADRLKFEIDDYMAFRESASHHEQATSVYGLVSITPAPERITPPLEGRDTSLAHSLEMISTRGYRYLEIVDKLVEAGLNRPESLYYSCQYLATIIDIYSKSFEFQYCYNSRALDRA